MNRFVVGKAIALVAITLHAARALRFRLINWEAICAAALYSTGITAASADIIAVSFTGTGSGTLAETPCESTTFEITAQYNTANVEIVDVLTKTSAVPLENAQFTIARVGSGLFELSTALFANRANENAGFTRLVTISPLDIGGDLLDLDSPLFATYDLLSPIGPIFDPTPFAFNQFNNVSTLSGPLIFGFVQDITYQTTLVPEPS